MNVKVISKEESAEKWFCRNNKISWVEKTTQQVFKEINENILTTKVKAKKI